jgi:hypothetical protein
MPIPKLKDQPVQPTIAPAKNYATTYAPPTELTAANKMIQSGIPKGLTPGQMGILKSRLSGQTDVGVNNAIAGMSRNLGGTSNPAFAALAARIRAGGTAGVAAKMADIDIAETHRTQDLEMNNRGLALNAAGIGAQVQNAQMGDATNRADLGLRDKLGTVGLNLQSQEQDWAKKVQLMELMAKFPNLFLPEGGDPGNPWETMAGMGMGIMNNGTPSSPRTVNWSRMGGVKYVH